MYNFSEEQLNNPPSCYRGTPFWAWNGILDKAELEKQIKTFKQMGFGGFYIHARTGLSVPYLSPAFLDAVSYCVEIAEKENMCVHLYDEDRFPSGSAGGTVSKNPRFRGRTLVISKEFRADLPCRETAIETGADYLVGAYRIAWNPDGTMHAYEKVSDTRLDNLYYAYSVTNPDEPWFNHSCYTDLLNPKAVRAFIDSTYEVYKKRLGDRFGKTIPSVFTDEPQLSVFGWFDAACRNPVQHCPWSDCLPEVFYDSTGIHLTDVLPEIFYARENHDREILYLFYRTLGEQFAKSYADQIGAWCDANNLLFTGHYHSENSLSGQTHTSADLMRQYKAFSLPGIDILRGEMEYTTVKQANSVVRQFGRKGLMCELYGVNHYDVSLAEYKFMGDWLSALGVSFRVPHLSYLSMESEAKRDYPPSFGYQSPWSKDFHLLEDHYARLNMILSKGKPVVKIAVLHPAESFWLYCTNLEEDTFERNNANHILHSISEFFVQGMLDFDFLSESLIPSLWNEKTASFGKMQYDVILVPPMKTMRCSTLEMLTAFSRCGTVIFAGDCPARLDGKFSDAVQPLYNACTHTPLMKGAILKALKPYRTVTVRKNPTDFSPKGAFVYGFAYRMVEDADGKWLFIADTQKREKETVRIEIPGIYTPFIYNTCTGTKEGVHFETENDCTIIVKTIEPGESVLFRLPNVPCQHSIPKMVENGVSLPVNPCVSYKLHEPNVLLLDMPSYSFDGNTFEDADDVLRINNRLREQLGWEKQGVRTAQPWSIVQTPEDTHYITLQYTFENTITVTDAFLALEHADKATVFCNDIPLASLPEGYYMDASIQKIKLPVLTPGTVTVSVAMPFTKTINPEACYLLGSFGVQFIGNQARLIALPETIGFSTLTEQGMPFYGAEISYFMDIDIPKGDIVISAPHFSASLLRVLIDGKAVGQIAFSPFSLRIPNLSAGKHSLQLIAVGGRYNTLAPLHNIEDIRACTPASWYPDDAHFTPSYTLHKFGITAPPKIECIPSHI